jgi:N-acetyl-alpha-D-muramate 1-phosphate uridylyltransferase
MASAIILAAGRGERMRPLTDHFPKPLLPAGGKPLIQWQVERLAAAGFEDIVVNHSHLGNLVESSLGDGRRFGVRLRYSAETTALETGGGVAQALRLLDGAPFALVSGDIHTAFDYRSLLPRIEAIASAPEDTAAHFVLVDNPPWHARGDMGLAGGRIVRREPFLTYANIAVFHPVVFAGVAAGTWLRLFPWAYRFVDEGRVSGEHFRGDWDNVGTPAQLEALDRRLSR